LEPTLSYFGSRNFFLSISAPTQLLWLEVPLPFYITKAVSFSDLSLPEKSTQPMLLWLWVLGRLFPTGATTPYKHQIDMDHGMGHANIDKDNGNGLGNSGIEFFSHHQRGERAG
jgi:hypothetical protein